MRRLALALAVTAAAGLVFCAGCAKLPSRTPDEGNLEYATDELTSAIPLDYGELVSVTTNETYPGWAQLWFRRADQSIVAVFVKYSARKLKPEALTIPRS